jgi:hypothetical protein
MHGLGYSWAPMLEDGVFREPFSPDSKIAWSGFVLAALLDRAPTDYRTFAERFARSASSAPRDRPGFLLPRPARGARPVSPQRDKS